MIRFNLGFVDKKCFHRFSERVIILSRENAQGYALATELILKATMYGYTIKEYPIKLYNRAHGTSKIKISRLINS